MEYQFALEPDLGVSAEELVAAWNETEECRAVAEARVGESSAAQYDPLTAGALAVLGGIALNIVSDALYDLIKKALAKKGVRRRVEFFEMQQPDGTRLVIVKIVE